ncbi:MAG: glycosyltransferase family 2 protein [Selenomonadaceae bacterium]|nr:glycosyltransferase family 2 protein [Selenomonadaceae bacterium]
MKLIERNKMLGIDKKEIDKLISRKNFVGLNKFPRAEKVIVSLTSYKPRINDVKYAIYSLLNQTFPPDKLILWLDEDSFPQREKNLPHDLLELKKFGLTINWCENLRPHTKYFYTLKNYPDDIIVTADDDIFYRPDWLKILYDEHTKFPNCLIAHRCHRLRLDTQGNLYPYTAWYSEIKSFNNPPKRGIEIFSRALPANFIRENFFMKMFCGAISS